ncbi:uncharacterized protein FIBRA_06056 [Fibroporia radiculosa]|uniref:Uncharacterized protein n=1 Tax=Fibroporia radiculosa TaxID=599839 RepID=J4GS44_9APHY|nr:uncharacterized protein FIBRA_06056 [Fibroporia radiculosa]CCM03905.1 predicted protein [Fibroporia radiculosa]
MSSPPLRPPQPGFPLRARLRAAGDRIGRRPAPAVRHRDDPPASSGAGPALRALFRGDVLALVFVFASSLPVALRWCVHALPFSGGISDSDGRRLPDKGPRQTPRASVGTPRPSTLTSILGRAARGAGGATACLRTRPSGAIQRCGCSWGSGLQWIWRTLREQGLRAGMDADSRAGRTRLEESSQGPKGNEGERRVDASAWNQLDAHL